MTCAGTATNFSSLQNLGCDFKGHFDDTKVSFKHPTMANNVLFTPDAYHMLKLARNAVGDIKQFQDNEDRNILWQYILKLSQLQENEGFYLADESTYQLSQK